MGPLLHGGPPPFPRSSERFAGSGVSLSHSANSCAIRGKLGALSGYGAKAPSRPTLNATGAAWMRQAGGDGVIVNPSVPSHPSRLPLFVLWWVRGATYYQPPFKRTKHLLLPHPPQCKPPSIQRRGRMRGGGVP